MRVSKMLCAVVLLAPAAGEAQITIRPGQYEFMVDMDLGIPKEAPKAVLDEAGFKNQKKLDCITAEDAKGMFRNCSPARRKSRTARCPTSRRPATK